MNGLLLLGGLFAAAILGLLVVATLVKLHEARAAQHWQTTRGKITRSEIRSLRKRDIDGRETVRSAPSIAYEYSVNGKRYTGERISLGENLPASDFEAVLARYPLRAEVTVYYDPAKPEQAVLERTLPPDFGKGLAGVFLFLAGGALLALLTLANVPGLIAPHLAQPENALFVTLSGGLGLFLLLLGFVQQRQALVLRTWPSTAGVVVASEVRSFRQWKDNVERTFYTPGIVYRYGVDGREYTADRYSLEAETHWGRPELAQTVLDRFPVGSAVTVYYNPQAPAEAVLVRRLTGAWLVWALAVVLLLLALWSAGVF
ncbi:MAG: hypothetical protein DDG60_05315 [Anaerolineae bacterium]|nr:MAG: hypothetical protein DDG60_05315 [Anaerolineae bacterium]